MKKRLLCGLFALCLLTNLLVGYTVLAEETITGTVRVNDTLRVRKEPNTDCETVGWLKNGDIVTILDTVTNPAGEKWYHISTGTLTGYSHSDYIDITPSLPDYETDEGFEAYLTAQRFPEDYKVALRKIHAQYPNWVFRAEHLSMNWEEALEAECKVGLNTVTSPDAWKSMEYGAYNWTTNTYVTYDSGGWVTAAPSLVAYYMDPRNWLDSTYIFQFEDLSYAANQTVDGIKAILPSALDKHAEDLLKASKETGVSAYFLATRMAQEGSQNNGLGTGTVPGYEGYYNFFHIRTYASGNLTAVQNGAAYAKSQGWNTPYKCLVDSAASIGKGYINLGQDTLYYQKFNFTNTTSGLYAHQYMSNVAAPSSEGRIRHNAATADQLSANITFNIPVFKSMPDKAAAMPSREGNNNNFLTDIKLVGITPPTTAASTTGNKATSVTSTTATGTTATTTTVKAVSTTAAPTATRTTLALTPTFDRYTMRYSVHAGEATSIEVTATPSGTGVKVSGTGTIQLYKGDNEIPITVTATSGETRTYTITVTTNGGVARPDAPVITGKTYTVGSTITKVEPESAVDAFIKNLAVSNGTAGVYTAAGEKKASGVVGTGDIVRLYSGNVLCASYPVVIYGDVNGDGKVSSLDLRIAQKHILKLSTVSGYYLTAADSSKDGNLSSLDLRITQKHILKITKTLQ